MLRKTVCAFALGTLLSGCASLIEGSTENVKVQTGPYTSASCRFIDNKGVVYNVQSPGTITVNRGDGPLKATCYTQGAQGLQTIEETLDPWTFGNIIFGGLIGITIDGISGAWQEYPEDVTITLNGTAPAATAPTYIPAR